MAKRITERLQRYIQHVAAGMDSRAAARAAGFSMSYGKVLSTRCRKNPEVAAAIAAIRAEGRRVAVYDLATAMNESLDVIAFAKQHRNSMAYFKAVEHRAKLSGLLVEHIEVFTADLRSALEQARLRVVNALLIGSGDGIDN